MSSVEFETTLDMLFQCALQVQQETHHYD